MCPQFTRTEQNAPQNFRVQREIQNCGGEVLTLIHVTLLGPRVVEEAPRILENFWNLGC